MTDLDQILPLWRELRASGKEYVLATVVEVEGSGYRKPGARMMIAFDGRRAGTISGGCLEADVARKAFWYTEDGPVLRRYSTSPEDGDVPFGMGCGGVIHLLLERQATADPLMERLAAHYADRTSFSTSTVLDGDSIGNRAFYPSRNPSHESSTAARELAQLAQRSYELRNGFSEKFAVEEGTSALVHCAWNCARPGLFVFGAGDDAIPLVQLARLLGWYVSVADGRSNLATQSRFPEADAVELLSQEGLPRFDMRHGDACVVLTHSLEQDTRIVASLLERELAYIGVLGPRRRTREMLCSIARGRQIPDGSVDAQAELWMARINTPMGLELGGDTPAEVALSVIAEIQRNRYQSSGASLRDVRAKVVEGPGTEVLRGLPGDS